MNERTQAFLAAARRHHAAVEFLRVSVDEEPALREWIAVTAFIEYATVHYINAYLWERQQIEPANHAERTRFVTLVREFQPIREAYRDLRNSAYICRYNPLHRESAADTRSHLDNLHTIQRTVLAALGQP